ncbi:MAG: glutamate cyclase domain-containing protein [Candidatus Hodarchaeota archaeon]
MDQNSPKFKALAETIDNYVTLDLPGVGLIRDLFEARQKYQESPMCLNAARLVVNTLEKENGPALIATGFPEGAGVPETDGPVGAAMLARALLLGMDIHSVIVTDDNWFECVKATCIGAGLAPMPLPESGVISKIEALRPVFIKIVPKDWNKTHDICDDLLNRTRPKLMFAVERPGMNKKGVYHGMRGRVLDDLVADLDYLFRKGKEMGIPFIGFGDGGNELGMGVFQEDLPKLLPQAKDCGCPCHGGTGAVTAADIIVVSSVSNWGVTGVIAGLALLLGDASIMHAPEIEVRSIELCTAAGGVDGVSMGTEAGVDGISADEWRGIIRTMRGIVLRGLGVGGERGKNTARYWRFV